MILMTLLFSIIQSVLGVGILLFGTPTLLLMGYSYHETLSLILPSSIIISLLQSINSRKLLVGTKYIYLYTLPMITIGMFVVMYLYDSINIKYIVGSILLLIGVSRSVKVMQAYLKAMITKNRLLYHIIMGLIHGVSNMGGGMLVVLVSTLHSDHRIILPNIAYTYLLFGAIQIVTLYFVIPEVLSMSSVLLAVASLLVYILSSKCFNNIISDSRFYRLTTFLIFTYGMLSFLTIG